MRFQSKTSNAVFTLVPVSCGRWALRLVIHPFIYSVNSFSEACARQTLSAFWNKVPALRELCVLWRLQSANPSGGFRLNLSNSEVTSV